MAAHIEIKTADDSRVHFDADKNDYTLCGLDTTGDSRFSLEWGVKTTKKVNCPDCIGIVKFCRLIKDNEIEQATKKTPRLPERH